ncbi:hypothetical protein Vretifemale_18798 [Volvox reticuliferus]|uniref:Carbohydrate kinase PfkB domain-containing protein n=1 Tax=Volvox reticuliferus TaxID=1737510 RepID=A0A8J4G010_9CHLO|nr:hypothetical protein Vretifemale_18798 [Volvox reticuliferus]
MLVRCSEVAAAAAALAAGASDGGAADPTAAAGYPPESTLPAAVLNLLLRHCQGAVVTRGVLGCVAAARDVDGLVAVPAVPGVAVVDTTGAGDHFTAGFMYGLISGLPLERCCEMACLAGASAVRVVGAELSQSEWQWFHTRLHGDLAGDVVQDSSAAEVAQVGIRPLESIATIPGGAEIRTLSTIRCIGVAGEGVLAHLLGVTTAPTHSGRIPLKGNGSIHYMNAFIHQTSHS